MRFLQLSASGRATAPFLCEFFFIANSPPGKMKTASALLLLPALAAAASKSDASLVDLLVCTESL